MIGKDLVNKPESTLDHHAMGTPKFTAGEIAQLVGPVREGRIEWMLRDDIHRFTNSAREMWLTLG